MDLDSLFRILQVALGIGLVIFVHELGHFLAARLCRVRVEVFSIGMGPRLLSWVRGTTRYQLALVPIGGYVRMAGEDRRLDGAPPEPGDLGTKSVGQRFFIYSGGVLMNVAFGLVVFPLIFYAGVPLTPPVLGEPAPGGPAWQAGLEAGTEVLAVDGQEVLDFLHVATAIALGKGDTELVVRDPDGSVRTVRVRPRYDDRDGLRTIDAYWDLERGPHGGYRLQVAPGSPLDEAGVETGDELLGVLGGAPGLDPQTQLLLAADGSPIELVVGSADGESRRTVRLVPHEGPKQRPRVGVFPPTRRVVAARGTAASALPFRSGDRLESLGGRTLRKQGDFTAALLAAVEEGTPAVVPYRLDRDGSTRTGTIEVASREHALALSSDLALETDLDTTVILVNPGEPAAAAGVRDGDRVLRVAGSRVGAWKDTHDLIQDAIGSGAPSIELVVARTGESGTSTHTFHVEPAELVAFDYGVGLARASYVYRAGSIGEAVRVGATSSLRFAQDIFLTLKSWMTRDVSLKNAGGPIAIAAISYSFAEEGWTKLFFFFCILSINLAILNVLPIPLLDGGHLAFLVVEKIKGSPVSERILVYSQVVGLVLILSLLVFITYNDLVRWVLPRG